MKRKLQCILLVDDDEPTNFLHRIIIRDTACTNHIKVSQNGHEAFNYLANAIAKQPVDAAAYPFPELILIDINMPRMDGWEFIEKYIALQTRAKTNSVIIMLSTSLNPDDEARAKDTPQIAGFIHKPLTRQMLQDILHEHFPDTKHASSKF